MNANNTEDQKSEIPKPKSQTNPKFKFPKSKHNVSTVRVLDSFMTYPKWKNKNHGSHGLTRILNRLGK